MLSNERKMGLLNHLYNIIFTSKAAGTDITKISVDAEWLPAITKGWVGRWFSKGSLRGFDIDLREGNGIIQLRVLEQNPNKINTRTGVYSDFAVRAQRGERIMWIIDRSAKENAFLGHIANGTFVPSTPVVTQTYTPAQPAYTPPQAAEVNVAALPDVPPGVDIPEFLTGELDEDPFNADLPDFEGDYDEDESFDPDMA